MTAPLAGASQTTTAPTLRLDGVAARVNESFITISDVMEIVRELEPRFAGAVTPASDGRLSEQYRRVLRDLIDRELILQAYREGEGRIPDWVIDRRVAEIVAERFDGDRAALRAALAAQRIEMAEWREQLQSQMILSAMRHAHAEQPAIVSPEMIREYYDRNRSRFAEPGAVRLSLIVLRPATDTEAGWQEVEAQAAQARAELDSGTPFEAVARRFSAGRQAEAGGDWGWLDPEDDLRPELASVVSRLETGALSPLILTPEEGYLARVTERRAPGTLSLEDAWDRIHRELQQSQSETFYEAWMARLRNDARIEIYELP